MQFVTKLNFIAEYRKSREDLSEATRRLNEMIANYGDVVPRRDFEFLKADFEVRPVIYLYHF